MSLIELLLFVLLCAGLGLLGHLVSPRWGWLAGTVPFLFVAIMMLVGGYASLIRELRYSFQSRPACRAGKCTSRRYILVKAEKDKALFRCRCGDLYLNESNKFSVLLPDGSILPYMVRDSSKTWKPVELPND